MSDQTKLRKEIGSLVQAVGRKLSSNKVYTEEDLTHLRDALIDATFALNDVLKITYNK